METTEVKPKLSKHISAAVNAIQKEIDRKHNQISKLSVKQQNAERDAKVLSDEIVGLQEQISTLQRQ